jgi:Trk-type K+ transport system membrane component
MFIGASSGSTGGGIKTSTFYVILISVYTTIRGRKYISIGNRTISQGLLNKAMSILVFSIMYIFFAVFLLSITDPDIDFMKLVFEEVSAFCTVGLSLGITADLSVGGQIVLIFSMLIGRVGTLTLAFSLASPTKSNDYKYPEATIMVG